MIDLHTHLFNAAYVPLEGAILSRLRHHDPFRNALLALPRALSREFVYEVAQRLRLATRLDDPDHLPDLRPCPPPRSELAERLPFDAVSAGTLPDAQDMENLGTGPGSRVVGMFRRPSFHPGETFRGWPVPPTDSEVELVAKVVEVLAHVGAEDMATWILALLAKESVLVQHLMCLWEGVDRYVVHMMDMGPHYDGTCLGYREQIRRTRALVDRYPKLTAFIGWSPLRAEAPRLIQDAVGDGFLGVKFYPPSGYRPSGNERVPRGDAAAIERANQELFAWCAERGVPIFAHCAPGDLEYARGAGAYYAHPKHWRAVLEDRPDLRLCLGHAGGEATWFDPEGTEHGDWRHVVVDLCTSFEHVYCEFGPLEGEFSPFARRRFMDRLLESLATPGPYAFGRKICFGSDFPQLLRHPRAEEYLEFYRRLFDQDGLAALEKDFFDGNARRYLGLSA